MADRSWPCRPEHSVCGTGGRWFEPTQLYQRNLQKIISQKLGLMDQRNDRPSSMTLNRSGLERRPSPDRRSSRKAAPRAPWCRMSRYGSVRSEDFSDPASFCRETPGFMLACVSSPIKLGTTDDRCRVSPSVLTRFLSRFHELPRWTARGRNDLRRSLSTSEGSGESGGFSSAR